MHAEVLSPTRVLPASASGQPPTDGEEAPGEKPSWYIDGDKCPRSGAALDFANFLRHHSFLQGWLSASASSWDPSLSPHVRARSLSAPAAIGNWSDNCRIDTRLYHLPGSLHTGLAWLAIVNRHHPCNWGICIPHKLRQSVEAEALIYLPQAGREKQTAAVAFRLPEHFLLMSHVLRSAFVASRLIT